jgi:phosphatidylserine/phosphatidylglycerophosphate/cardiolipin synthase-like enzyme
MRSVIFLFCLLAIGLWAAEVSVYFSPKGGCTEAIIKEIAEADSEIRVQAYSFTSAPIAQALVEAKKRKVDVIAILDESNETANYSGARFLANAGIPVWIDYKPAIAHSKIMIIDQKTVITGSFNFTKAAEEKNTENLLILKNDRPLVEQYVANFAKRLKSSRPYNPSHAIK